jgi:hypothetical protein
MTTTALGRNPTHVAGKARQRAMRVIGVATIASLALLVDLLVVGHTSGEEIWGLVTAAGAAVVGALSYAYLAVGARSFAGRLALYALWATVAFFGFGGYNSHRLPVPAGTVEERERPPLAPLVFTVIGVAGAVSLRSGAKEV